jgi:hypothetical protein
MGDLNETHDEFSRRQYLCALLPDEIEAAALALKTAAIGYQAAKSSGFTNTQDFLVLSREKPPVTGFFPGEIQALYSPWEEEPEKGSYFFRGEWETIDHFLLSQGLFSGSGWEYDGFRVLNQAPFTGPDGTPDSYVPRSGRGLSDHLPLLLYLRNFTQ